MKTWLFITLVMLAIMSMPAISCAVEFEGVGARPCEYFTQVLKQDPSNDELWFSWAQGFMSATNIAKRNDASGIFKSMPMEQQKAHIKSFCEANPKKKYAEAVADLYRTLYPVK